VSAAKPRPLLIFPCNGNGVEALACLGGAYRCIGFVDDAPEKQGSRRAGLPVLPRDVLAKELDAAVLAVPGSPESFRARRRIIEGLGVEPDRFARVVHPAAHVSPLARVGRNVLIMAGVVITSDAVIGDHVCILPNSVVHHDVVIGDWALVGSNVTLAGGVILEEGCYVAGGSRIKNAVRIGRGALVGLGSNVLRDVAPGTIVAGNPAAPLRARAPERAGSPGTRS
jgi:sugar O-acyltransferase (sialic acid O-acetyltransferase NeuD family)